jgi:hypothetical protein
MADIKDRIPFNLHPVSGWIQMAAQYPDQDCWSDMLYGWAYGIDGDTYGHTWYAVCEAIESEQRYWDNG